MLRLTSDGETTKAPFLLKSLGLADSGVAGNDDGVEDETVLVSLDLADHVGLSLGRAVVVNDTQTALESHVDGHLVLSDRVHGGRDEGGLEGDALGDGGIKSHRRGSKANVARQKEEIVVSEATVLGGVHQLVQVEAILLLVLTEHLEGATVVEDGGGHFE